MKETVPTVEEAEVEVQRLKRINGDNLDVASADALEYALKKYEGTIIAVSHDRWLLKSFQRFLVFGSDGFVKESDVPTWQ